MHPLKLHDIKVQIKVNFVLYGREFALSHSKRAIEQKLISRTLVFRILKELENGGDVERKPGVGLNQKITPNDIRNLKINIIHNF